MILMMIQDHHTQAHIVDLAPTQGRDHTVVVIHAHAHTPIRGHAQYHAHTHAHAHDIVVIATPVETH